MLEFLDEKTRKSTIYRGWMWFPIKRARNGGKNDISNHGNGKNQKYDEGSQCMKEGMHMVLKLIENWADECSIVGVIDINGMVRRDDFGEIKKWIY